jgi:hypothetical protein
MRWAIIDISISDSLSGLLLKTSKKIHFNIFFKSSKAHFLKHNCKSNTKHYYISAIHFNAIKSWLFDQVSNPQLQLQNLLG